jgi:hypothetical protein
MRFKLSVDLIYNVDSKRRLLVTASVYVILNKKHWYMRCANYFSKKFGWVASDYVGNLLFG